MWSGREREEVLCLRGALLTQLSGWEGGGIKGVVWMSEWGDWWEKEKGKGKGGIE